MQILSDDQIPAKLLTDLPSPPAIIQRLNACIADQEMNSFELARIIETDQAFTARILKLVNSPFYGFSREIVSVEEAITMLGINAVHRLLLTTSMLTTYKIDNRISEVNSFWRHSFGVGVIAKHLLFRMDRESQQEAFVSGILHDIGRLIYMKIDPDMFMRFYFEMSGVTDLDAENEYFGVDHQRIGEKLAEKWNFPKAIIIVIANHHTPNKAEHHKLLLSAVNIADMLCHALQIGNSGNYYVSKFYPEAWKTLQLSYNELDKILRRALNEIEESENTLIQLS